VLCLCNQADATKRETHAYKHAELRSADDNCTFKPTINRSSKDLRGRSVDELSRGDAAHNLDLKVSEAALGSPLTSPTLLLAALEYRVAPLTVWPLAAVCVL
jgi:hypothetical protein